MGWILYVATTPAIAIITAMGVGIATATIIWRWGSIVVTADEDGLQVGRAFLERSAIGEVQALDSARWRAAIGPLSDRRSYLVARPYISSGISLQVTDPDDPTSQWLVSSRNPEALVQALNLPNRRIQ